MSASLEPRGTLRFALNGELRELPAAAVDPSMTLNEYLREREGLTATKLVCGEGGCGACAVVAARVVDDKPVFFSLNSCLRPLAACDGLALTTAEGLGSAQRPHAVQARIAAFHGTQCGFCTPGFTAACTATLAHTPDATMATIEREAFDGNICRCTGYRPLLDACRSFGRDSDIEDVLGCAGDALQLQPAVPTVPAALRARVAASAELCAVSRERAWLRPMSVDSALAALAAHPGASVVAGSTARGVYKHADRAALAAAEAAGERQVLVDIGALPLGAVALTDSALVVGGGASLRDLIEALEANSAHSPTFAPIAAHVRKIASLHVRAVGTVAGNLAMARTRGFWSDLATLCLAADATIEWVGAGDKRRSESIDEFLAQAPAMPRDELIAAVHFPRRGVTTTFVSYRSALRKTFAHAFVNSAFEVTLSDDRTRIEAVRAAFGAVGEHDKPGETAVRAKAVEAALAGTALGNSDAVKAAIAAARAEIVVKIGDGEHDNELAYRRRLVTSMTFKMLAALGGDKVPPAVRSAGDDDAPRLTRSKQVLPERTDGNAKTPLHDALPKTSGLRQATGEAVFTDDIPVRANTLHAALVLSDTVAAGTVKAIDTSALASAPGNARFIGANDVPGVNNCHALGMPGRPVFADPVVSHFGHQVGIVVAETQRDAQRAATLVRVDVEPTPAFTTVDTAVADLKSGNAARDAPFKNAYTRGDVDALEAQAADEKSELAAVSGTLAIGTQKHFYMENMGAYCHEDEDGVMVVFTGAQWPSALQAQIAGALGRPLNRVRCVSRRSGGGFGGRLTNNIQVCVAAAVACAISKRPVKLIVDRRTDMLIVGGREETSAAYTAIFEKASGKLRGVRMHAHKAAGFTPELSFWANDVLCKALSECYTLGAWDISCANVLANTPARSATRGPGDIEASLLIESILAHVAHAASLDAQVVRDINLVPAGCAADDERLELANGQKMTNYESVPEMWAEIKATTDFAARQKAIDAFNAANRFKKRGIALTPVRYEVSAWPRTALVNIYADGSIAVIHGGAEIGQGLNTKAMQAVAQRLATLFPEDARPNLFDLVRVADSDSIVLPNQGFTGGSTGSEGVVKAAIIACDKLLAELKPVLAELEAAAAAAAKEKGEKPAPVTWQAVCAKAGGCFPVQPQCLSAIGHWTNVPMFTYQVYGAGVSEVEIDVLDGHTRVLSSSIRCDTGGSLNPAIDIGQTEGAFVMGLGFVFSEQVTHDAAGKPREIGTWSYKPALAAQIPENFTVALHKPDKSYTAVDGSSAKAVGEPPLVLAASAAMATRAAIQAARKDAGLGEWVSVPFPYTPPVVAGACCGDVEAESDKQLSF